MANVGQENAPTYTVATSGVVAVGTTAVQLPATGAGRIIVRAAGGNTGTVTLGGSGVTSLGGLTLSAGQSQTLDLNNLNMLYAIASGAGQSLEYLALT